MNVYRLALYNPAGKFCSSRVLETELELNDVDLETDDGFREIIISKNGRYFRNPKLGEPEKEV